VKLWKPDKESHVNLFKIPILALTLAAFITGSLWAAAPQPAAAAPPAPQIQTKCPVEGGNINRHIYADYQGKRIYFCCDGCITAFQQDPEKYLKLMKEQGVEPEPVPTAPAQK
jgi:YHS domain-containing protein